MLSTWASGNFCRTAPIDAAEPCTLFTVMPWTAGTFRVRLFAVPPRMILRSAELLRVLSSLSRFFGRPLVGALGGLLVLVTFGVEVPAVPDFAAAEESVGHPAVSFRRRYTSKVARGTRITRPSR